MNMTNRNTDVQTYTFNTKINSLRQEIDELKREKHMILIQQKRQDEMIRKIIDGLRKKGIDIDEIIEK